MDEVGKMQILQDKTSEAHSVAEKMRDILNALADDPGVEKEIKALMPLLNRLEELAAFETEADCAEAQARERAREIASELPASDIRFSEGQIAPFVSELVLQILSSASQAKQESRKQRQAEGIAAAKAKGVRFGREPKPLPINFPQAVFKWQTGELSMRAAARECGMSASSFSSAVKRLDEAGEQDAKTA